MGQIVAGLNLAYLTSIWQVVAAILVYLVCWGILHKIVLFLIEQTSKLRIGSEVNSIANQVSNKELTEDQKTLIEDGLLKNFLTDACDIESFELENQSEIGKNLFDLYSSGEIEQKFYISEIFHKKEKARILFLILPLIREAGKIKVSTSILTTWISLRFWILEKCGHYFLTTIFSKSILLILSLILVVGLAWHIGSFIKAKRIDK